jgi:hypothetical protein
VRLAAEVHREVRRYAQSFIKPGIKLADMCERLENKNRELVQVWQQIIVVVKSSISFVSLCNMLFVWGKKGSRNASVLAQKAQVGKRVPLSCTSHRTSSSTSKYYYTPQSLRFSWAMAALVCHGTEYKRSVSGLVHGAPEQTAMQEQAAMLAVTRL